MASSFLVLTVENAAVRFRDPEYQLKKLDCRFSHCESGERGLEFAQSGKPDVIILDFTLPDMSALDFLRAYRKIAGDSPPPVIGLVSAQQAKDDVPPIERYLTGVIQKPYSKSDLERMTAAALLRHASDKEKEVGAIEARRAQGTTTLLFRDGWHLHARAELQKILSPTFLRSIAKDKIVFDLTHLNNIPGPHAQFIEKIRSAFKSQQTFFLAGRNMGAILSETTLGDMERTLIFLSQVEMQKHFEKAKTG